MSSHAFNECRFSFFIVPIVLTKIDNYTLLDYSMIDSPKITESSLDLDFKVTFPSSEFSLWMSTTKISRTQVTFTHNMLLKSLSFLSRNSVMFMSFPRILEHFICGPVIIGISQPVSAPFERCARVPFLGE